MALACMAVCWALSPSLPHLAAPQDQSSGQVPGNFCGAGEAPGGDHLHLPEAAAPGFAARCAGAWHGPFSPRFTHPAGAPRALEPGGPSQSIHLPQGQFQVLCLGGGQEIQTSSQLSRTISLHFLETEGPRTQGQGLSTSPGLLQARPGQRLQLTLCPLELRAHNLW